jgi:hypothetical protein
MSGSASLDLELALLQHTLAIAPMTAPGRVYVALCQTSPSEQTGGIEASGGGYARVAATFSMLSATIAANAATVEFPAATTDWGAIGYFEIWTGATGGERLYWGPLVDPADGTTPLMLDVLAGDIVRFSAGTLSVQVAETPTLTTGPFLPLIGGTLTGPLIGPSLNLTGTSQTLLRVVPPATLGSGQVTGPQIQPMFVSANVSGTVTTGQNDFNSVLINSDHVNAAALGGMQILKVGWAGGDASMRGNRTLVAAMGTVNGTTGNTTGTGVFYVGLYGRMTSNVNDNGTAGAPKGNLFGGNTLAKITSGATYWNSVVSLEVDLGATAGSSLAYKQGIKVVLDPLDAVQGSISDYGLGFGANGAGSPGLAAFKRVIQFGSEDGWWIGNAATTLIGTGISLLAGGPAVVAAFGVDFSAITFNTAAFKSAGFQVDGAGVVTAAAVQTGTTSGPTWTSGTAAPTSTQPVGSLYSRVGGAVGATLYVSRGGGTWAAVAGV